MKFVYGAAFVCARAIEQFGDGCENETRMSDDEKSIQNDLVNFNFDIYVGRKRVFIMQFYILQPKI